jgi:hypothetical protein
MRGLAIGVEFVLLVATVVADVDRAPHVGRLQQRSVAAGAGSGSHARHVSRPDHLSNLLSKVVR